MARIRSLIAMFVFVSIALTSALVTTPAFAGAKKKPAVTVNYDDPNMAFSADYAVDTAATCPKTLKGRKLRECLLKNGFATSEEISDGAEILTASPPSSFH